MPHAIRTLLGLSAPASYLPFLRRYVPAMPFPFFFLFCGCVYCMFRSEAASASRRWAFVAGIVFAVLVFSYFFLWTAAAAWLCTLTLCALFVRPANLRRILSGMAIIGALALLSLAPYAVLLSRRVETLDSVQALTLSHAPDVFRLPELIGLLTTLAIALATRRRIIDLHNNAVLFTASFALLPLVVFNQQILTGRSLQPIHYEQHIANYAAMLAAAFAVALIWRGSAAGVARRIPARALIIIALAAYAWGLVEMRYGMIRYVQTNLTLNDATPALLRLAAEARDSSANQRDDAANDERAGVAPMIFSTDAVTADYAPTVAPQPVLWASHQYIFPGIKQGEGKERFYQYLYYSGVDAARFTEMLTRQRFMLYALFGWERVNARLTANYRPITPEEISNEQRNYLDYAANFNRERAANPTLTHVLVNMKEAPDLSNLDLWYERDQGQQLGNFMLYRVKLRR